MNERKEIKLIKLIMSHCTKVEGTDTIYDGGFVVLDIFHLVSDIDEYYKKINGVK